MKTKWTEVDTAKVISASLTLIIAITFYFIIMNLGGIFSSLGRLFTILSPFITGFVIAYLLTRPVNALDALLNRFLFKKAKRRKSINRAISITLVIIITLSILSLIMYSIIPQLIESVARLARNADGYFKSINDVLNRFSAHFNLEMNILTDLLGSSNELFKKLTEYIAAGLPKFLDFSVSIGSGISNFVIGFIVSIYMLANKEKFAAQIKKSLFALLPEKFVDNTVSTCKYIHETFGKYFYGQILDCCILGVICFIVMSIFGMEYALLISMIIAITNFIPFIGPLIGVIPSAFILLMAQPAKVVVFIVIIIVLQQIDSNLLVPKIVGKTTGLSALWVILSIVLGGGLFGVTGVILAVPTFSVIYAFTKQFIEKRLKAKNLSDKTRDYY